MEMLLQNEFFAMQLVCSIADAMLVSELILVKRRILGPAYQINYLFVGEPTTFKSSN